MTALEGYSVATLRYYPDLVTQEFVNVGVAVVGEETGWWGTRLAEGVVDIRRVFPSAQPKALAAILQQMTQSLERRAVTEASQLVARVPGADPLSVVQGIVGETVGSVRWAPELIHGVSRNLSDEVEYWFDVLVPVARHHTLATSSASVERTAEKASEAPITVMRLAFEKRGIWKRLTSVTVDAKAPIKLDHCFKNERLHVFEPISLAQGRTGNVIAMAERWRGRIDRLSEAALGDVSFYGLVRLPPTGKRLTAAEAGYGIISASRSAQVRLFREEEVEELSDLAAKVVAHHDNPLGL